MYTWLHTHIYIYICYIYFAEGTGVILLASSLLRNIADKTHSHIFPGNLTAVLTAAYPAAVVSAWYWWCWPLSWWRLRILLQSSAHDICDVDHCPDGCVSCCSRQRMILVMLTTVLTAAYPAAVASAWYWWCWSLSWRLRILMQSPAHDISDVGAGKGVEEEVRVLDEGSYFGEQALLREECRTASVIATPPGVECLVLDREWVMTPCPREWSV